MAEITRKRTGELLRKLFEILLQAPDGMQARDALTALSKQVTLTPYEAGNFESGGVRFEKIVRFATVDCVKAGWMQKNKGMWSITQTGINAYKEIIEPESAASGIRRHRPECRRSRLGSSRNPARAFGKCQSGC